MHYEGSTIGHPKLSPAEKSLRELESRIRHLQYTIEDYERQKGKGAFAKKYPESAVLYDSLLTQKVNLATKIAVTPKQEEEEKDQSPTEAANVPIM